MQVTLMHPAKGTQKRAQSGPHALLGVGMGFKPAVTIIIPRPFPCAVTDGVSNPLQRLVTLIFVGVNQRLRQRELLNQPTQGTGLGILHHPQAHLSGFTPNHTQDRWTVIGIGASSAPLIGATARWVERVKMLIAFFPPRSGRRSEVHTSELQSRQNIVCRLLLEKQQ